MIREQKDFGLNQLNWVIYKQHEQGWIFYHNKII